MSLTKRQREVLDAITGFIEAKKYSPSYEELGTILHISSLATVHKHVYTLREKGYIRNAYNQTRSIEINTGAESEYHRGYRDGLARGLAGGGGTR